MSIYIKGIDMPKEGEGIQLWIRNDGTVECVKAIFAKNDDEPTTLIGMERARAIYISEPHGRLIDGDSLWDRIDRLVMPYKWEIKDRIDTAPTIIEGSK